MSTNSWLDGFNRICEWIMRLAYLNVVWMLFTVLGLFLFGIGPATVALYTIIRKWLGKEEAPVVSTFLTVYKSEFIKANILGFSMIIITLIMYVDWVLIQSMSGVVYHLFLSLFYIAAFILSVSLFYLLPVYVHFEGTVFHYYKSAFLVGMSHPFRTLIIGLSVVTFMLVSLLLPGAVLVFGGSGLGFVVMYISYSIFQDSGYHINLVVEMKK